MNKYKKIVSIIIVIVVLILPGIFASYIGINFQIKSYKFLNSAEETKAKITKITSETIGYKDDTHTRHEVFVDFSVNGHSYGGKINQYIIGMKEGDEVSIYYERENPKNFQGAIILKWGGIFLILGGMIFIIVGSKLLLASKKIPNGKVK